MKYGTRPCRECGAPVPLVIQRDIVRKFYCNRSCRTTYTNRLRDPTNAVIAMNTPQANRKKGHPGQKHNLWKPAGSKRVRRDGYVLTKIGEGKWDYEHRVVTQAPRGKHVHHRDNRKGNNTPSNLELLTPSEHIRLHGKRRRY